MIEIFPQLDEHTIIMSDVDSCAVKHESMTDFTRFLGPEVVERVEAITTQGMSGNMGFVASLDLRAEILYEAGATRRDVQEYGTKLQEDPVSHLTPSFVEHADWIAKRARAGKFLFMSGGMDEMVVPILTKGLGVPEHAIWSNAFLYEDDSPDARIIGYQNRPLYHDLGKLMQIRQLREQNILTDTDRTIMLGDGDNDRKSKGRGGADHFIAFTEIVDRGLGGPEQGVDYTAANLPQALRFAATLGHSALKLDTTRKAI